MGTDSKNRPQPLMPKKQGVVSTARLGDRIATALRAGTSEGGGRKEIKGWRQCQTIQHGGLRTGEWRRDQVISDELARR